MTPSGDLGGAYNGSAAGSYVVRIHTDAGTVDCVLEVMLVSEAAKQLQVSVERVRQLVRRGDIKGHNIGGRWLLDRDSVERAAEGKRRAGRPFEPRKAWALLCLAGGRKADWLMRSEADRLGQVLRDRSVADVAAQLRRRARSERWFVHPSLIEPLLAEDQVVVSGARATEELAGDRGRVLLYVHQEDLEALAHRYSPERNADNANVVVRAIEGLWPFEPGERRAWPVLAAVDLLDEHPDDPRCRAVADRLLAAPRLAHRVRPVPALVDA